MTSNDLGWLFDVKIRFRPALCCRIDMRLLEPTAQIWMKIDAYHQQQKCRPMTLVSGNIRFMWIFEGVPSSPERERQTTLGVVDDGNFWQFRCLLRLLKLQRYGKQYYNMTICYPLSAGNWLQNEWPWMAISCQNPFSASTSGIRAFECQNIIQPLRFCSVLYIAWSVSYSLGRHAQLTRCFSAVAELLVLIIIGWGESGKAILQVSAVEIFFEQKWLTPVETRSLS